MVHILYVLDDALLHFLWNDDNRHDTQSQCCCHYWCSFLHDLEPLQWIYDPSYGKQVGTLPLVTGLHFF